MPKKASDDVLQQTDSLLLHKLIDHIAEHSADSIEALVCLADVGEADIIEQDLLDDEDGDRLAELGTSLHNTQT